MGTERVGVTLHDDFPSRALTAGLGDATFDALRGALTSPRRQTPWHTIRSRPLCSQNWATSSVGTPASAQGRRCSW